MALVLHMLTHVPTRAAEPKARLILPRGKPPGPPGLFGAPLLTGRKPKTANLTRKTTVPAPMPFITQGPERLDAVLNLRLTSAEKAKLQEDADLAGLSMSELVRRRYFGRPILANADAVMLKELRRLGGLLKHVHTESGGSYSAATSAVLGEIRAYIQKLSAGHDR